MHLMYFTEQPMSAYPAEEGLEFGATALMFSNKHFDPVAGSRLYNEYLEDYIYAEECGIDGIMLNEHHNAPFCMQAKTNVFASHPGRHHQEGQDRHARQPAAAVREPGAARRRAGDDRHDLEGPAGLRLRARRRAGAARDRRQSRRSTASASMEAHDLIVKAWTTPGPFRWEGTHYQHRVVNPWAVPLQKPHPRVWIPGVLSTRDDHLGGAAALPVHLPQHLGRGDQEDLGDLRQRGGRGRLRGRARRIAAT